jgi:ADP-heptose:LPS heptosyltransferase
MHILKLEGKVDLGPGNTVEPGTYLVENLLGAQLLVMGGGGEMEPLREKRVPDFTSPSALMVKAGGDFGTVSSECRSLLIGRTGGLGDLTLLTPVLREIKRRWPTVKIAVASIADLQQSIQNLPFIDELLPYPVSVEKAITYDGWIWLENVVEKGEDSKTLHSVDCVAKFIGLELPEDCDKLQAYVVTPMERADVQEAYPRIPGVRRLCIQPKASAACRTYNKTGQVIAEFLKKGWEVFLLGREGEFKTEPKPGLRTITDGWSFRHRAALVETCDCLLAPDSSLLHVAGALKVPAVGLYSVFPWQLRTKYAPTTRALTRLEGFPCAPCHHHATPTKAFPDHCPTKAKGYCGVMDAITVEQIVKTIEEIARVPDAGNVVGFKQ